MSIIDNLVCTKIALLFNHIAEASGPRWFKIKFIFLTCDFIKADKANFNGLINNYFSEDKLVNETKRMAIKIANKSSQTLKIGKKAFYNQAEMKISDAYKYASEIMIENMMNQVSEEGIASFLEKIEPKWS